MAYDTVVFECASSSLVSELNQRNIQFTVNKTERLPRCMASGVCVSSNHPGYVQYLNCKCCTEVRYKVFRCSRIDDIGMLSLLSNGMQHVPVERTTRARLTDVQVRLIESLQDVGGPIEVLNRIRSLIRAGIQDQSVEPSLNQIISYRSNHPVPVMSRSDIRSMIDTRFIFDGLDGSHLYAFGCRFGTGVPGNPIIVGFTTGKFMSNAATGHLWHCDTTFKLSRAAFKLIVLAVTDSNHAVHPIAFCLSSDLEETSYKHFFQTFSDQFGRWNLHSPHNPIIMCDGELAMRNGLRAIWRDATILMCNIHVLDNALRDHTDVTLSIASRQMICRAFWCLVYSSNKPAAIAQFLDETRGITGFAVYFARQWVNSTCNLWHLRDSPPGTPSDNNAIESLNAVIKRSFTKRKLSPLPTLLNQLGDLASYYCSKEVRESRLPSAKSEAGKDAILHHRRHNQAWRLQAMEDEELPIDFLPRELADLNAPRTPTQHVRVFLVLTSEAQPIPLPGTLSPIDIEMRSRAWFVSQMQAIPVHLQAFVLGMYDECCRRQIVHPQVFGTFAEDFPVLRASPEVPAGGYRVRIPQYINDAEFLPHLCTCNYFAVKGICSHIIYAVHMLFEHIPYQLEEYMQVQVISRAAFRNLVGQQLPQLEPTDQEDELVGSAGDRVRPVDPLRDDAMDVVQMVTIAPLDQSSSEEDADNDDAEATSGSEAEEEVAREVMVAPGTGTTTRGTGTTTRGSRRGRPRGSRGVGRVVRESERDSGSERGTVGRPRAVSPTLRRIDHIRRD